MRYNDWSGYIVLKVQQNAAGKKRIVPIDSTYYYPIVERDDEGYIRGHCIAYPWYQSSTGDKEHYRNVLREPNRVTILLYSHEDGYNQEVGAETGG